jgi:peptidoglycan/LPS O-acetylase OafA/YrhL
LIRLFPPLLICSIITFLVFRILDSGSIMSNSHSFKNLLISLIFISPNIINHIFDLNRSYINGSYWFLWTEIQFYLIASFVYFVNRKHFIRNYTIFSLVTSVLNYSIVRIIANTYTTNRLNLHFSNYFLDQYKFWSESLDFLRFNYLFLIGIFLFILYEKKYKISTQIMIGAVVLLEFLTEPYFWNWTEIWIIMIIILLLLVFIYFPKSLKWISFKPLTSIGLASYSLYLIHENIGVLLINKYANSLGNYNFLFPVLLMILLMYFCYLGYKYIEKPLTNYLKVHFVK